MNGEICGQCAFQTGSPPDFHQQVGKGAWLCAPIFKPHVYRIFVPHLTSINKWLGSLTWFAFQLKPHFFCSFCVPPTYWGCLSQKRIWKGLHWYSGNWNVPTWYHLGETSPPGLRTWVVSSFFPKVLGMKEMHGWPVGIIQSNCPHIWQLKCTYW